MFITVEGGNHWSAERRFVEEFKLEVEKKHSTAVDLRGGPAFLAHIRSEPEPLDFVFISGILALIDSRMSIGRENVEVAYWFTEHRKVEDEHIVLSDIFALNYVDLRVRRLLTHRIRVAGYERAHFRVMSLNVGRVESGKLGERSILEAIETSNRPLTPEEAEQREKELEGELNES